MIEYLTSSGFVTSQPIFAWTMLWINWFSFELMDIRIECRPTVPIPLMLVLTLALIPSLRNLHHLTHEVQEVIVVIFCIIIILYKCGFGHHSLFMTTFFMRAHDAHSSIHTWDIWCTRIVFFKVIHKTDITVFPLFYALSIPPISH